MREVVFRLEAERPDPAAAVSSRSVVRSAALWR